MSAAKGPSLQQQYAPNSICYGCGPDTKEGLHIASYVEGDTLVCDWGPEPKFQAFPGWLYGGLLGCLLDCHCNWTAAYHLMQKNAADVPPATVTAEYTIKFLRPTPADKPLRLVARVVSSKERSAAVDGQIFAGGELCATTNGVFVAVKPDHPAYHRW
jgi:acyl-coenzyme A thioesterase PaaI-like protein